MPVDRTLAEDLARNLVEIYTALETQIVTDLARRLTDGIDRPDWASEKLASVNDLRNSVQRMIAALDRDLDGVLAQQVAIAFARGGDAALAELARVGGLTEAQLAAIRASLPGAEAINAMVWSLASKLRGTHVRILRWPLDVYRTVVAGALPEVLAGVSTRLATSQKILDRFLARGVTGFTDRAGRQWELASYVEMATRTGVAQAAVQGHFDRLGAAGIDLVQVSDSPQECERCRPWEGKILDRAGGGARTVEIEHAINDGEQVTVRVAGSVVEAIAAGLMHPNCRHSFRAYLPGVTKYPLLNTQDPEGDRARQKQRGLERAIRKAKLVEAGALDAKAKRAAAREVRARQAALREHLAAHPDLMRLRHREQIAGRFPGMVPAAARPDPEPARVPDPVATPAPAPEPVREPEPTPTTPASAESPADRIAAIATQQPAETRTLGGGATAHTDLVTYDDGQQLVRKVNGRGSTPQSRRLTDAEPLGAAILAAVGLRSPGVYQAGPNEVFMEHIAGTVGAELGGDMFEPVAPEILDGDDGKLLGLADVLMGNMDRNIGNWILDPEGRLVGIDHGFAFENQPSSSPFARYLVTENDMGKAKIRGGNPYTAADMARLKPRLEALKPMFTQRGRAGWHKQMMSRFALIERGAQGSTDRIA